MLSLVAFVLLAPPGLVLSSPEGSARKPIDRDVLLLSLATSGDGRLALAVGEHGRILRRTSSDPGWELMSAEIEPDSVAPPMDVLLTRVIFAGEEHAWAAGHDATIIHSGDGGRIWELQFTDPEAEAPFLDLWFENADHGLALGAYGLAYETFDAGMSWESRDLAPEGPHLYSISESPAGSLYVAGEFGTLLRSGDRGDSWTELASPYAGTFFGTLALSDESILVFGLRGNLYRSEDVGATWNRIDVGTSASILAGLERSDGSVLLTGLAGTILESHDLGRTFRQRNRADRLALTDIAELGGTVWLSSDQGILPLDEDSDLGDGGEGR